MANTTNFGWETPDDTDLVKDGAAAMRTLGSAIDTSLVDLKGGTTGQILSKATNTDMDFTWITNDVGDITAVTASAPLTGGGTTGAITVGIQDGTTSQKGAVQLENSTSSTSTTTAAVPASVKSAYDLADGAIAKTTLTTAGDLIYRNATIPTRLALGTAGQVLTVNSGATAPEWKTPAGGGGKVLQVVQATYSTSTSTTSSSATDTGLSASITPSASTSKVLIMVTQPLYIVKNSVYITEGYFKLLRGSTALTTNDYIFGNGVGTTSQIKELETVWSISYLDSPSTTSSITYKTQMSAYNTGTTTAQIGNTTSIMILMEIGA